MFLVVKISLLKRSFLKMLFQGCVMQSSSNVMQDSSNSVILETSNLEQIGHKDHDDVSLCKHLVSSY